MMGKDPAFLFYYVDFAYGTRKMSFEEKGAYITLICEQADSGHLEMKDIERVLGNHLPIWDAICCKYIKDSEGKYYNEILEKHLLKRRRFTESRKMNLKSSHMDSHTVTHMDAHMENENRNIDINESISKEEDKEEKGILAEVVHPLQKYINENFLNVAKIKKQLSNEDCERILADFPKAKIKETLEAMENKKDLTKKYLSVNLTLRNWLKRDGNGTHQQSSGNGKSKRGEIDKGEIEAELIKQYGKKDTTGLFEG